MSNSTNGEHSAEIGEASEPRSSSVERLGTNRLRSLAALYGTPLYIYDFARIRQRFGRLNAAFSAAYSGRFAPLYALKANSNLRVVDLLRLEGAGAECISAGELRIAAMLGFPAERTVFTSSSKSPAEIDRALGLGVVINLDSFDDLDHVCDAAQREGKTARVSFRVNPDVDPQTHRHIATGHKLSKFGVLLDGDQAVAAYRAALERASVRVVGLHCHLGSQMTQRSPFERGAGLLAELVRRLRHELGLELEFVDVGGGIGIPYRLGAQTVPVEEIAEIVAGALERGLGEGATLPMLVVEPGRYFVGDAGVLVTRVNSVKHTPYRNFVNVDTGFNHLLRPILYEAWHNVVPLVGNSLVGGPPSTGDVMLYDIAGNICETGDILAEDRELVRPRAGDLLAIEDTGAYGFTLASEYNSFALPAEVMVEGERHELIRRRGVFEDLLRSQTLPPATEHME